MLFFSDNLGKIQNSWCIFKRKIVLTVFLSPTRYERDTMKFVSKSLSNICTRLLTFKYIQFDNTSSFNTNAIRELKL